MEREGGRGIDGWRFALRPGFGQGQKNQSLLNEKKHVACHSPSVSSGGSLRMPGLQVPLLILRELPIPKEKLQSIPVSSYCPIQYRFTKTMWSACSSEPVGKTNERTPSAGKLLSCPRLFVPVGQGGCHTLGWSELALSGASDRELFRATSATHLSFIPSWYSC